MVMMQEPLGTVPSAPRRATRRHYVMCPPTYFSVTYAINPWMDPGVSVDTELAVRQWQTLRETYRSLGHQVDVLAPLPGLPDMVYTANGATVVGGTVLGARFRYPQRAAEAQAHLQWFRQQGFAQVVAPEQINEGEGDFLVAGPVGAEIVLAGTGFRTDPLAHAEAATVLAREVVTLELVDPRYYHLDTALAVLSDDQIAWLPEAFSAASQQTVLERFPGAITASPHDAGVFGLNAVSDGLHVVLPAQAAALAAALGRQGYVPVTVDLSELRKGGGGPKCCTLEIRH